jgi:hypothetical protein
MPEFQENHQIVFATEYIESEYDFQGPPNLDIVLVKWNTFKRVHGWGGAAYSESYESNMCCESVSDRPSFSQLDLLSTLEVKRDSPRDGGQSGKGKAKRKLVKSMYTEDFWKLGGDLEATRLPKPDHSTPLNMVGEDNPKRTRTSTSPLFFLISSYALVGTRTGLRDQEPSPSTLDRLSFSFRKRRGDLSAPDEKRELEAGHPRRPQKNSPNAERAIRAGYRISSYFDISHTIDFLLIGTRARF